MTDFTNYSGETTEAGKLTKANINKAVAWGTVESVCAYNGDGADLEVSKTITPSKAYKELVAKYGETEREYCSVTFFVKYEEEERDTKYIMHDFTI